MRKVRRKKSKATVNLALIIKYSTTAESHLAPFFPDSPEGQPLCPDLCEESTLPSWPVVLFRQWQTLVNPSLLVAFDKI